MTFKGNEANSILSGILLLLILLIVYKEIGYKRSQRFNWALAIIPTPGLTCKLDNYFSTTIDDEFNPLGTSYDDESKVISDRQYYYSGYNKRDILLYPDLLEIRWLILEEKSHWEAKVELPKGYAKNHIGAPYIFAQFFPGGVVTFYIGDIEEEKRTTLVSVQGKMIPSFKEGYSLYEDCVLPVTTQIEIASNCFDWVTIYSDERTEKKDKFDVTESEFYPVYVYKEGKRGIPERIYLKLISDSDSYFDKRIELEPDADILLQGMKRLDSIDSLAQKAILITHLDDNNIEMELFNSVGPDRITIPFTKTLHNFK